MRARLIFQSQMSLDFVTVVTYNDTGLPGAQFSQSRGLGCLRAAQRDEKAEEFRLCASHAALGDTPSLEGIWGRIIKN